ncbi:STN domain-containing protein [Candidatus Uabimicrobium sp. HlEnr_7]|uniref:STN domain-containing protein n=1 Tax=Candidatus Uabimicrobium helgolandensis TaxID=3095367 RepID=UPI00355751B5
MKKLIILCFCFVTGFAQYAKSSKEIEIQRVLENVSITLDLVDVPFDDVIRLIRVTANINLLVDPVVLKKFQDEGQKVTFSVESIKLKTALNLLCDFFGLTYVFQHDVLFVTTIESELAFRKRFVRLYDVRSLRLPTQYIVQGKQKQTFVFQNESHKQKLKNVITSMIAPGSWNDNSIGFRGGFLVVKNIEHIHQQVETFLKQLENSQRPLSCEIFIYEVENYKMNNGKEFFSSKKLIHQSLISALSNVVSSVSTKKENFKFNLVFLPVIINDTTVKFHNQFTCSNLSSEYGDKGVSIVLTDYETTISALPLPNNKTLLIKTKISSSAAIQTKKNQQESAQKIKRILQESHLTMHFTEAPLVEVVDFLRHTTGLNIILNPSVMDESLNVDIQVKELSLASILDIMLFPFNFEYKIENGIVIIQKKNSPLSIAHSYYIQDLCKLNNSLLIEENDYSLYQQKKQFSSLAKTTSKEIVGKFFKKDFLSPQVEKITRALQDEKIPQWLTVDSKKLNFIDLYSGYLFVRAQSGFHRELRQTLHSLRQNLSKNVRIECSFANEKLTSRLIKNESSSVLYSKHPNELLYLSLKPTVQNNHIWLELNYQTKFSQGNITTLLQDKKDTVVVNIDGQKLKIRAHIIHIENEYKDYLKKKLQKTLTNFSNSGKVNDIVGICKILQKIETSEIFEETIKEKVVPVVISHISDKKTHSQIVEILYMPKTCTPQTISSLEKAIKISDHTQRRNLIEVLGHYVVNDAKISEKVASILLGMLQYQKVQEVIIKVLRGLVPNLKDSKLKKDVIKIVGINKDNEQPEEKEDVDIWGDDDEDDDDYDEDSDDDYDDEDSDEEDDDDDYDEDSDNDYDDEDSDEEDDDDYDDEDSDKGANN